MCVNSLLVVPDLPSSGASSCGALATRPAARLRFGPARPLRAGWRAGVAAWLGRPDLAAAPVAQVVAAALPPRQLPADAVASGGCWLATPLHLVAGLDTVHLPREGILGLTPEERDALAADFGRTLGEGRVTLRPAGREAFVLSGLELDEAHTVDPVECLGGDLADRQPSGPGSVPLRRLMSEMEMWLHDHPVNQRRAARGVPEVRALWLWGGATPLRPAPGGPLAAGSGVSVALGAREARGEAAGRRVFSDDAWVRAAARLAGADLAAEGAGLDDGAFRGEGEALLTARFHGEQAGDAATFEARFLDPALAALREGSLGRLAVLAPDRAIAVESTDRYRLWRPRRDWLTALGA